MTELLITRGLPASGKTTWAERWVAEDPEHRARVNRDSLRTMIHGGYIRETERTIIKARDSLIKTLLSKGISVVCDDTNLRQKVARDIATLGWQAGVEVEFIDFTQVPLNVCVLRDRERTNRVGDDVIHEMHKKFLRGHQLPNPERPTSSVREIVPYVGNPLMPQAIIVDLDGTVAMMNGRSPYDFTRVSEDSPNPPIVEAVRAMSAHTSRKVLYVSGRSEDCRHDTQRWISQHLETYWHSLFMRPAGDNRDDAIIKREIFDEHIRNEYNVIAVFDDRQRVVDMWRSLGLTVLQVAPGNF